MKTGKSKAVAILLVIATLFLIYGIYAVFNAVQYVTTYTTASTITTMGSIHYIVTSSMAYFGFASVLIAASLILMNINRFSTQTAVTAAKTEETSSEPENSNSAAVEPVKLEPAAAAEPVKAEPVVTAEPAKSEAPAAVEPVKSEPDAAAEPAESGPAAHVEPAEAEPVRDTVSPENAESEQNPVPDSSAVSEAPEQKHDNNVMPAVSGELKHKVPQKEPEKVSVKYTDTVPLPAILTSEIDRDFKITTELLRDIFE